VFAETQARQRLLPFLDDARRDSFLRELLEAADLALALDPSGVVGRKPVYQSRDSLTDLEREMGGSGSDQLADVIDCYAV
jgi:hypothetical protein